MIFFKARPLVFSQTSVLVFLFIFLERFFFLSFLCIMQQSQTVSSLNSMCFFSLKCFQHVKIYLLSITFKRFILFELMGILFF